MANNKPKLRGNGEGTIYKSGKTGLYVGQYVHNGKRYSMYQKKNEKIKDFKDRFNDKLSSIRMGTYIEPSTVTLYQILNDYIENKYSMGIIGDRSYLRNKETLSLLEKTCDKFIYKPIQEVNISDIKKALPNFVENEYTNPKTMKTTSKMYSQNIIDKEYTLLNKGFKIATSERIVPFNIMDNESIVKPKTKKETKNVEALTIDEQKKLIKILNKNDHKYNDILLLALFTGARIGEILAITQNNIDLKKRNSCYR